MKKIKKAAVLVPAFATVVLATVGSVTGTMAWFTASRSAVTQASVFESKALSDSLAIGATANNGVSVAAATDTTPTTVTASGKLTNASYDQVHGNLSTVTYENKKTINDQGTTTDAKKSYSGLTNLLGFDKAGGEYNNWTAGNSLYYAVSWTYTFTYTFNGRSTDQVLLLDRGGSVFADGTTNGATFEGFRMSIDTTGDNDGKLILAPDGADTSYVVVGSATPSENTAITTTTTTNDTLSPLGTAPIQTIHNGSTYNDNLTIDEYKEKPEYVGTFPKPAEDGAVSFTANVVVWFEGTDKTVIDTTLHSKVTAGLMFYVRSVK